MPTRPLRSSLARVLGTCALLALIGALPACRTWGDVGYAREFPERAPIVDTLPIQVVRDGTRITLTNTTAGPIPPSTLWLNKWYSRPLDRIEVGETLRLDLREFRDEFSEPFRAGGFWATGAGDPLVSAHLEREDTLVGLVVVTRRGG